MDRRRFRFSLSPNLKKFLADRRANISGRKIDERVRAAIKKVFAKSERMAAATRFTLTGVERALLYAFTVSTGLRAKEIRSPRRSAFDLASTPATVTLAGHDAKNRGGARLNLPEPLVPLLTEHLQHKLPDATAFAMPCASDAARILKADRADAKIAFRDAKKRQLDFQAFRHPRGVWLFKYEQANPRDVQHVMRLKSVALVDRYTRSYPLGDGWAGGVPDMSLPFRERGAARSKATGTDDACHACAGNTYKRSQMKPNSRRMPFSVLPMVAVPSAPGPM